MSSQLLRAEPVDTPAGQGLAVMVRQDHDAWRRIATVVPQIKYTSPDTLGLDLLTPHIAWDDCFVEEDGNLVLRGQAGPVRLTTRVCEHSHDMLRIETRLSFRSTTRLEYFRERLEVHELSVDDAWWPQHTPAAGMVSGDFTFHCPAAMLQSGTELLALLPNVRVLGGTRACPYALVCDPEGGALSFGCMPYRLARGTYCAHYDTDSLDVNGVLRYAYYLYYRNDCRAGDGIRQLARRIWKLWGASRVQSVAPQSAAFDTVRAYAHTRLADEESLPLHAAYGMALAAQRTENKTLAQRAATALDATLELPQTDGFFDVGPTYGPPDRADLRRPALMSWRAYWMCRWYEDVEPDARITAYVKTYADALLRLQKHGGHIPAWVTAGRDTSGWMTKSAESAAHLLFLARLHAVAPHEDYERGGRRIANFIIRELMPAHAWSATETCRGQEWLWRKRRPRDEYQAPEPRSPLALWWAAEGLRSLSAVTGTRRYRLCGERVLGELLLGQQLWDAPFCPVPSFGGFAGASNALQWNNCLSGFIATTLMDYYEPSGLTEYFHRGIAALRAAAAMVYCRENEATLDTYAGALAQRGSVPVALALERPEQPRAIVCDEHDDGVVPAGVVGTAIEHAVRAYGDLYIDTRRMQAFGINGIVIDRVRSDLAGIAVSAREALGKAREIIVRTDQGTSFPVVLKADARFDVQV